MKDRARLGQLAPLLLLLLLLFLSLLSVLVGCGGHSARTARMRTALDAGRPHDAIAALDEELRVERGALPDRLGGDDALLVLDRATIQQSVGAVAKSKRDYEAADKALDVLDLSHGTADAIGRWAFSDSAGRYVAPPHEKLLLNVFDMLNYLESGDLSGARVEARRMVVMARFLRDHERTTDASLALGSLVAGFVFEKSGDLEEARRFYADAVRIDPSLRAATPLEPTDDGSGELLVVIGYGRVPHRIARHVPIGLALTRASTALAPHDRARASELAAQGLVTWVNFPELAPEPPLGRAPSLAVDGAAAPLDPGLDVTSIVRRHFRSIEGEIMAAAITRTIARVGVGKTIEAASKMSGKKGVRAAGLLLSLVAQIAMTAADVPDTRSWETLPARIEVARIRLGPGVHRVRLAAAGAERTARVRMGTHGWSAVTLLSLR